jgi:hypothetical protein
MPPPDDTMPIGRIVPVGITLIVIEHLHLDPVAVARGLADAASSFAQTSWVAWFLVLLTLVPALMLPRRREGTHLLDDEANHLSWCPDCAEMV